MLSGLVRVHLFGILEPRPIAAGVACDVIQFVHGDFSAGMSGGPQRV